MIGISQEDSDVRNLEKFEIYLKLIKREVYHPDIICQTVKRTSQPMSRKSTLKNFEICKRDM